MSTAIQPAAKSQLSKWVAQDEARDRVAAILGDTIPVDQFLGHILTEFQDPKFSQCSDKSKFDALHEAAALGLSPRLGQIVFVPYKGILKATPQWQGYKAVMERHPKIEEVTATLVHVSDDFCCDGTSVVHTFNPLDSNRVVESAKDLQGGYCTIYYSTGRPPKYHFVPISYISKAQACAQSQSIWTKWYKQMAIKTLYRDCYARRAVPVDPLVGEKLDRLTKLDDINLGNDPNRVAGMQPQPKRLTTADIMGATEPEPAVQEPEPEPGEMTKREEYLAYIEEADSAEQLDLIGDNALAEGMAGGDLEVVSAAIEKRRVYLTRGERSN